MSGTRSEGARANLPPLDLIERCKGSALRKFVRGEWGAS
jgi:hypothetical protein